MEYTGRNAEPIFHPLRRHIVTPRSALLHRPAPLVLSLVAIAHAFTSACRHAAPQASAARSPLVSVSAPVHRYPGTRYPFALAVLSCFLLKPNTQGKLCRCSICPVLLVVATVEVVRVE